jgi:general secretion pathway protein L
MPATDTLFQFMEPLRLRYLDSPLPGWLRLAGDTVLSLLPEGLRRQLGMRHRRLLLGLEGEGLSLRAQLDDRSSLIGVLPLDDTILLEQLRAHLDQGSASVPRWLMLDAAQVLRPVLSVPAAAEARLREVMQHEIDRQTPFAADQVSFEPRVLARDPQSRQLKVELVVLPKARLDAALAKLGPLAAGLAGVDVLGTDGQRLGVNLLPLTGRSARQERGRDLNRWLALGTVLALGTAMWLSLDNRSQALADYSSRVDSAKKQARDVRTLRNALRASAEAANFLAKRRAQMPTTLEVLDDLTRRIPDSTSLEKISINDGNMVLIGQSQQASAMVGLLQGSALVRTPTLTGSVQTDPRTGKERFTLTAVVAGSSHDKEAANASAGKR